VARGKVAVHTAVQNLTFVVGTCQGVPIPPCSAFLWRRRRVEHRCWSGRPLLLVPDPAPVVRQREWGGRCLSSALLWTIQS
jgi:hypothetical protein